MTTFVRIVMECDDILIQICDELAEDINSEVCERLRQHLMSCDKCRTELTSMKSAVNLFRCLEDVEVPPHIHERLLEFLNAKASEKPG